MTAAVCLRCGSFKTGAWTLCAKCGFAPSSPEDQAQSIALSDHNLTTAELEAASEKIKSGQMIQFDDQSIEKAADEIRAHPELTKVPLGCVVAVWTPVVVMIVLFVLVISLLVYSKFLAH